MNILFDINHPAHIHLFKNAIRILEEKEHNVIITSRDKDITIQLLDIYGLQHIVLSRARKSLLGLACELIWRQIHLFPILLNNKINICVSVTGASNVHICKLFGIPTLVFYDTEHAKLQNRMTLPFVTNFISPASFKESYGKKHITYNGTHDLAYLHPKYFSPNKDIYKSLNIPEDQRYIIIRFVSWQAAHDVGQKGISLALKRNIIELCKKCAKVFITSEAPFDNEFEEYRFPIPPENMHNALSFATMYIGEGGSMATEAAVLGTPSILISSLTAGVFEEYQNDYGLMYSFLPNEEDRILETIKELFHNEFLKQSWQEKRNRFIEDKIDITEWMVNKILEYQKK